MAQEEFIIGVLSDTHVPDRAKEIHPAIIPIFRDAGVGLILHAGDICIPSVLKKLEEIAPVTAVRGNRDWAFYNKLSLTQLINVSGVDVALLHGHGNIKSYFKQKFHYFKDGYQINHYLPLFLENSKDFNIAVFGHSHYPEILWQNGKLYFNPGSASKLSPFTNYRNPTVGLIRLRKNGQIDAEIVELKGRRLIKRQWVEIDDRLES